MKKITELSGDTKFPWLKNLFRIMKLTTSESDVRFANQQQKPVSGKVTDSAGAPIPGVTAMLKGTATGTITDSDGKYSLSNVPDNATLQFSFVGMETQEVAVSG